ncbi:MAG: hypothetical protein GXO10_02135 [Crenarchaeota archaeon]|nr:hypothetical protein [Thermoproteota archaeon]
MSDIELIRVPKLLVEKAKEKGIDLESKIVEILLRELKLDPNEEITLHTRLSEQFLNEGREIIDKDPVQASEKLYRAVEECIKALAIYYSNKEEKLKEILNSIEERGRWTVTDLEKAVRILTRYLGDIIDIAWDAANYLHVWGFHEAKLDNEGVRRKLSRIEKLISEAKRILTVKS